MKATEQYFPMVLLIMLNKVVLAFESVDKILKCDHSNKSYLSVFSFQYRQFFSFFAIEILDKFV